MDDAMLLVMMRHDLANADDAHGYKRQKVHLGTTHSVLPFWFRDIEGDTFVATPRCCF